MVKKHTKNAPPHDLYGHIRELFFRLLASVFCLAITSTAVYFIYEPILNILRAPLNAPLYYDNPAGSFSIIMKVCFMGGLIITVPLLIYNLIMYIQPVFSKVLQKKHVYITTSLSSVMAVAGALFAYYCILPGTLEFFAGFRVNGLSALISAENYLNFVTNIIIVFIIIFQLPLLLLLIDTIKRLPPKILLKNEKWVVILSLVIAIITPFNYDLITSLLVAVPIITLYNLSIILIVTKHLIKSKKNHKTQSVDIITTQQFQPSTKIFQPINTSFNAYQQLASNQSQTPSNPKPKLCMDIITKYSREPIAIKQPIIPNTKKQPQIIYKKTRCFSDISRKPHINHAITA